MIALCSDKNLIRFNESRALPFKAKAKAVLAADHKRHERWLLRSASTRERVLPSVREASEAARTMTASFKGA
ncbi:hypothetical protein [Polyangium aurulentum]|uniref:hypothetical protein n=1 Tax=Polyangium aurulentum TaxID=2567896 RepID=UPI0010AEDFD7|nr:hypothetical protein [Polyangium aurulentum]UQA60545.1 hypothetical protein E8A73_008755 [Polyangium aurulentum]